jgi:hypothetical protein
MILCGVGFVKRACVLSSVEDSPWDDVFLGPAVLTGAMYVERRRKSWKRKREKGVSFVPLMEES